MIIASIIAAAVILHIYQSTRPNRSRRYEIDRKRVLIGSQPFGSTPKVMSSYTPVKSNGKPYTFNEVMKGVRRGR